MAGKIKPRLARGTRDFLPRDMAVRNHILDAIKKQFELFRFEQIETPAIENLETLTGKYGDEGDQLIFKILNSGDYLKNLSEEELAEMDAKSWLPKISEKALRYDLTVPFARFVVQHQNELTFPFRRYQIQPVWRADRPAKGRYREFYQCDADIIGSNSIILEAELIELVQRIFRELNLSITIKINSRKLLQGFSESNGLQDRFIEFTTLLDKLDKKPWEELKTDFSRAGFKDKEVEAIHEFVQFSSKALTVENLLLVHEFVGDSEIGKKGIEELTELANYVAISGDANVELDLSLARGLNYYTGAIVEVVANGADMGSICGGGRYDDLTGIFGLDHMSGIGISFGIDRIYDLLKEQLGNLPLTPRNKVLYVNFGRHEEVNYALKAISEIRNAGVVIELYPDPDKLKKQFKYADQVGMSHVLIAGTEEMEKSVFRMKTLSTGEQVDLTLQELIHKLKN